MKKEIRHVIKADQFTKESLEEIFILADDMVANPDKYSESLKKKIVATLFYEPSTRTRLSFETAALQLGAGLISTENAGTASSEVKGETIKDTIEVTAGYADAIVMRHPNVDSAEIAARVSSVPILNAGSGSGEHPTQALLDVYTIKQVKEDLNNLKVAVSGDLKHGRTIHSLIKLLSLYDNTTIYGLSRAFFRLPQKYIDYLIESEAKYIPVSQFEELPNDLDILYHTRTQLERFKNEATGVIDEYIINNDVMKSFSNQTYVMHPLPRVKEISEDFDNDPRAIYIKQAHNGVPIRKALLLKSINHSY